MTTASALTAESQAVYDHDFPGNGRTIRTVSGQYVDLFDPSPMTIRLTDIAHALSLINRFGGHMAHPYSVAEHSLGVSNMVLRRTGDYRAALLGLLHDAPEAYLGDMVRPLKHQPTMGHYRDVEAQMEALIFRKYAGKLADDGVPFEDEERLKIVKEADTAILGFEMSTIRNAWWRVPTPPDVTRLAFLKTYDQLFEMRPRSAR